MFTYFYLDIKRISIRLVTLTLNFKPCLYLFNIIIKILYYINNLYYYVNNDEKLNRKIFKTIYLAILLYNEQINHNIMNINTTYEIIILFLLYLI